MPFELFSCKINKPAYKGALRNVDTDTNADRVKDMLGFKDKWPLRRLARCALQRRLNLFHIHIYVYINIFIFKNIRLTENTKITHQYAIGLFWGCLWGAKDLQFAEKLGATHLTETDIYIYIYI